MNHVIMLHQYQLKDPVASTTISSWSKVMTKHLALFSLHICILKMLQIRRWIFAFVRHQKGACDSLHNHPIHSSSKICSKVNQMIADATEPNPSIKPRDVARGKGVNAIPGAIDKASNHMGRIAREVRKSKNHTAAGSNWDIAKFEDVANDRF